MSVTMARQQGRPRRVMTEPSDVLITIRVTRTEAKRIEALAERGGQGVAPLCRDYVMLGVADDEDDSDI